MAMSEKNEFQIIPNSVSLRRSMTQPLENGHDKLQPIPTFKRALMNEITQKGVVKVFNDAAISWSVQPWSKTSLSSSGTGFIIANRMIVTNAHCVEDARSLQVKRQIDSNKYPARILAAMNSVDIAFITVDDDEFWNQHLFELQICGDLIEMQSEIDVVGYPVGGETVCITNGVVSRIDWHNYAQSGYANLCITVDAAINSGNSGGPALHDGKVIGVAFQSMDKKSTEGVGYIIPSTILRIVLDQFFKSSRDHWPYKGHKYPIEMPTFGFFDAKFMKLENPSMQKYVNLPTGCSGVYITHVPTLSYLYQYVSAGDVVTKIDGTQIGFDGMIPMVNAGGRIDFRYIVSSKTQNQTYRLTLFRKDRRFQDIEVVIGLHYELLPRKWIGPKAQYLMFAGLVFVPLSRELLHCFELERTNNMTFSSIVNQKHELPWQYVIVISTVLAHSININVDYHILLKPLEKVNGRRMFHLADLAEEIDNLAAKTKLLKNTQKCEIDPLISSEEINVSDSPTEITNSSLAIRESPSLEVSPNSISLSDLSNSLDICASSSAWLEFEFGEHFRLVFDITQGLEASQEIGEEFDIKHLRNIETPIRTYQQLEIIHRNESSDDSK